MAGEFRDSGETMSSEDAMEAPATPQGLTDLPLAWLLLLINDHLDAEGRLKLFQTGKAMSRAVLQHEGAQLILSTSAKQQTAAQQAAAQAFAAAGTSELTLKLQGRMYPIEPCLWPCVTSLELRKVTLPENWMSDLHNLTHLDTLLFKSCRFPPPPDTSKVHIPPLTALRKLTLTQCTPLTQPVDNLSPLLAGSHTLTHLVVDDRCMLPLVSELPALTALQCVQNSHPQAADMEWDSVSDKELTRMITHPTLQHVVLGKLGITADYSNHPCRWKTLLLMEGIRDVMIAQLPLAGLETLTIGTDIMVVPDVMVDNMVPGVAADLLLKNPTGALDNLRTCRQVSFKGTKLGIFCPLFTPQEPCFYVSETSMGGAMVEQMKPRLLGVMRMAAQCAKGVLVLGSCTLMPEVLGVVKALNPGIHTFCMWNGMDVAPEFTKGLLTSLPTTIHHLVFGGRLDVEVIVQVLSSGRAPVSLQRITLTEPKPEPRYPGLPAAARQKVDAAAATHQPQLLVQWQTVTKPKGGV